MKFLPKIKYSAFKKLFPTNLFARAFLILALPMLIVQMVAIYVFFVSHLENIERHLSYSVVGDITFILDELKHSDEKREKEIKDLAFRTMLMRVSKEPIDTKIKFTNSSENNLFTIFTRQLDDVIEEPFSVRLSRNESAVIVRIKLEDSVIKFQFSVKRLSSVTGITFTLWMVGPAILLLMIATVFLRNQIRPISKLAIAAENFGKGQYNIDFRPQGASEVRAAGHSFIAMRDRITRMISARTDMLAGISHDLRTPLTRMKLELAMMNDQKYATALLADVNDMEKMIKEYLDFARGESGENAREMQLSELLEDIVAKYSRQGKHIKLSLEADPKISLFKNAMRRCFYNLIDNAFKYGTVCEIMIRQAGNILEIIIDDNGCGIAESDREIVMQPFKRLDASRNLDKSGAGLGLSIAQDIILRHGGEIILGQAGIGGLRVIIKLPV